jgi:hypothetical protein
MKELPRRTKEEHLYKGCQTVQRQPIGHVKVLLIQHINFLHSNLASVQKLSEVPI